MTERVPTKVALYSYASGHAARAAERGWSVEAPREQRGHWALSARWEGHGLYATTCDDEGILRLTGETAPYRLPARCRRLLGLTLMATPHARTRNEARIFLNLVPCPGPWAGARYDVVVPAWHPRVLRLAGTCPRCGQRVGSVFELADPPAGSLPRYAFGFGDEPSRLVDAGQWLLASRRLAEDDGTLTAGGPGPAEVNAGYDLLYSAAAAVDEVLKFVPPGAEAVPDEAFWTDDGLAPRTALPEWFVLDRLVALRLLRWQAVTDFEDIYDIGEPDEPAGVDGVGGRFAFPG